MLIFLIGFILGLLIGGFATLIVICAVVMSDGSKFEKGEYVMDNQCFRVGSCCKRCKHIMACEGDKIAYTAIKNVKCAEFEEDDPNACEKCELNRKKKS